MFTDKRSKRVVFVAHCVLNQNAKIDRCAHYPGAMRELTDFLIDSGAGIVQMPCPELIHLGLDRRTDRTLPTTVESEDDRVAGLMREDAASTLCDRLAEEIVHQVRQYRENGFEVAGILGINGSPTCGVETNWRDGEEAAGAGVFIRTLCRRLQDEGFAVPARGVKASRPEEAISAATQILKSRQQTGPPGSVHR